MAKRRLLSLGRNAPAPDEPQAWLAEDQPAAAPDPVRPATPSDEQRSTAELLRQLQDEVAVILETALAEPVISESPHQLTGGGYQTIRLGDRSRQGFRMARPNLLRGFELKGRSVCDLGANLGEISRDLRRAGASLVDAYEYDPFFTQLARYITAYNGLTDVNHLTADVSEAGFLRRRSYDICVGLSAYSFMQRNIDYICRSTSEQVIIETHEITDERWYASYVEPVIRHHPHWCCFARVPHGGTDSSKWRLWLTFSQRPLMGFYGRRARSILHDAEGVISVDLRRSLFPSAPAEVVERRADPLTVDSLDLYSNELADYERQFTAGQQVNLSMHGSAYWLALLCGISQFEREGGLTSGNVYLRWLKRGIAAGRIDPAMTPLLEDDEKLRRRVAPRVMMLSRGLRDRTIDHCDGIPIAYNATPFHPALGQLNFVTLALEDSDERLSVSNVDGYHRLFLMKMLDIDVCPMVTIWSPEWLPRHPTARRVTNYERRMYQYLAGTNVDAPAVVA